MNFDEICHNDNGDVDDMRIAITMRMRRTKVKMAIVTLMINDNEYGTDYER